MTTTSIPFSRLIELHAALERACREVPYTSPSAGTLWGDLNAARAIVATYLLPVGYQEVRVTADAA